MAKPIMRRPSRRGLGGRHIYMTFNILHVNVERDKHTDTVVKLLKEKDPHVVCFAEAMYKDVVAIADQLGYTFAFVPLVLLTDGTENDQEGSAILSKYPILETQKLGYSDAAQALPLEVALDGLVMKNGERPQSRFSWNYTLLTARIQLDGDQVITISTTHFPVTDHSTPGYADHEIRSLQNVDDMEHSKVYLERLIAKLRSINGPLVFTADLNNPRGEFFYDTLAHELVDHVPHSLTSSIDPNLHRAKDLKLVVDTIMTSPDVSAQSFEVIEGVSDHKAFLAMLDV